MSVWMLKDLPGGRPGARPGPGTIRRVLRYLRPQAVPLAVFVATTIVDAALAVALPLVLLRIIDNGVLPGELRVVGLLSLLALVVVLLSGAAQVGVRWLSSRLGHALVFRLRDDTFAHAQQLPIGFYTGQRSGALISRLNNDTEKAQAAVSQHLQMLVSGLARLAFMAATIAYLSWPVLLIVMVASTLVLLPAHRVGRRLHTVSHQWLRSAADLTTFVTERFNVSGALVMQLYGGAARDRRSFSEVNARNRDLGVRGAMLAALFGVGVSSASSVALVTVYLVGGYLVVNGAMTLGTLVALAALVVRLFGPLQALSHTQVAVMTALAGFERVFELMDRQPHGDRRGGQRPIGRPDTLEFDRVQFAYRPQPGFDGDPVGDGSPVPVLREVSFRVTPGQRVAVVGPSGAGKSTIAALAARLHEVDAGAVRVGGQDVREVELDGLRRAVGVLAQDAYLFHDTIRANLRYAAPEADDARLAEVCRASGIWSLIRSLPEGLDTMVGDRGYRLSGGEKQRVAIARLLLRDPQIVVLDEATAHLDTESERAVQRALDRCLAGRTTLVIAHRLSTVRDADEILVLAEGRIVERGRHDELVQAGGRYTRLYRAQRATSDDAGAPDAGADLELVPAEAG